MHSSRITRVLDYWNPLAHLNNYSNKNKDYIITEFLVHLNLIGIKTTIQSIHSPDNFLNWPEDLKNWHRDENDIDKEFIVWSNVQSIDILFNDNSMLAARDGAIILVNNLEVLHRTPMPINSKRWLVRSNYLD